MSGIKQAIEQAGSMRALASQIGVTFSAVQQWAAADRVPPKRVLDVERITGVHRHHLNPDIYPDPPPRQAA